MALGQGGGDANLGNPGQSENVMPAGLANFYANYQNIMKGFGATGASGLPFQNMNGLDQQSQLDMGLPMIPMVCLAIHMLNLVPHMDLASQAALILIKCYCNSKIRKYKL